MKLFNPLFIKLIETCGNKNSTRSTNTYYLVCCKLWWNTWSLYGFLHRYIKLLVQVFTKWWQFQKCQLNLCFFYPKRHSYKVVKRVRNMKNLSAVWHLMANLCTKSIFLIPIVTVFEVLHCITNITFSSLAHWYRNVSKKYSSRVPNNSTEL